MSGVPVYSNSRPALSVINFGNGVYGNRPNPAIYRARVGVSPIAVAVAPAGRAAASSHETTVAPVTQKPFASYGAAAYRARTLEEQKEAAQSFKYDNKHNGESMKTCEQSYRSQPV